jgi:hypothetical protein
LEGLASYYFTAERCGPKRHVPVDRTSNSTNAQNPVNPTIKQQIQKCTFDSVKKPPDSEALLGLRWMIFQGFILAPLTVIMTIFLLFPLRT